MKAAFFWRGDSEISEERENGGGCPQITEGSADYRKKREGGERCGRTLFLADWLEAVFLHYRVRPEALQAQVPFPLDLREGDAWVSLVAFTMHRLRPAMGGWLTEGLFRPLCPCRFLNLRTYVRGRGEPGIYFMSEWISNRLSVPLGPVSFGLPYRAARLEYAHHGRAWSGEVRALSGGATLQARAESSAETTLAPAGAGSLDEFLLERYAAFTEWSGWQRVFRIAHRPWLQQRLVAEVEGDEFLRGTGPWYEHAQLACAHGSPGVRDVKIGWPGGVSAAR